MFTPVGYKAPTETHRLAKMTRDEMLSALAFGDFDAHKEKTSQMIKEGKVPAFPKN